MHVAVTTPLAETPRDAEAAAAAARAHGLPAEPRRGRSLAGVARACGAEALLVVGAGRVSLWAGGAERAWDPGMAALRLRRHDAGERRTRDAFLEAAELRPGDAVLDATLGLGMDAFVAAGVVGAAGRVVGVEASPALAAFVAEGLRRHPSAAARRIEVVHGDAAEVLARFVPRSFDVVVFDPMFRRARAAGAAFDLVRRLGTAAALAPETLARARGRATSRGREGRRPGVGPGPARADAAPLRPLGEAALRPRVAALNDGSRSSGGGRSPPEDHGGTAARLESTE